MTKGDTRGMPVRTLDDLTLDPKNANTGTPRGRQAVEDSLRAHGAGRAVLTDRHGVVIAGNKTVEAAKAQGLSLRVVTTNGRELVVVQREDLDLACDPRAKKLALADNRTAELGLAWDADVLRDLHAAGLDLSGFWTPEEFAALVGEPTPGQTDANAVVAPGPTDIVRGDLFALGRHRLLCGDATADSDVARVLDGATPHLMVTDPPYGVDYTPHWRHDAYPVVALSRGRRLCLARRVAWRNCGVALDRRRVRPTGSDRLGQAAFRPLPRALPLGARAGVVCGAPRRDRPLVR